VQRRIPGKLGIAPGASYITSPHPYKIGRLARMEAFSLDGIEFLHKRYFPAPFKKLLVVFLWCALHVNL
jgi:hypothetical protein